MKNKYFTKIEKWQKVFAQILSSRLLHDPSLMKFKNFYGELLFIGMLFFPCSIQYDVVHPGPCLEYGNRFCEEKVANSFCLKKKNKCYCKPQFVNIKESYGVTCKPLLTNLKCNMDKNCRDVDGSTCHPGAGACTCPYNTLYVPQLHACKKQILSPENDAILCIKCKEIGGECFQYTNQIGNIHSYPVSNAGNNFPHIGCSCPGITTIQSDKVDDLSDAICNQILVDIGHPCNNMDLICRSSKAVCFETSLFSYSICHCPPGHVAVYQEYLGYHECYPSIKLNVDSCRLCLRTNGLCFDMNADEQPDGCYCGRLKTVQEDFKANGAHNDQNSLLQTCSKNIVEIFCWPENLKICYYPPKAPNHARFIDNITKQRALIFITDGHSLFREDDSGPNNECLLTIEETHRSRDNSIRFCIEKQLNTLEVNLPCGISATKYSNGYLYSGYVAVWVDKYFADPISDQLIDFSCKCDYSFLRMTPGQAIDRSWPVENINLNYNRESNTTTEFFNFSILNPDNSVVYSVFKMAPIKLYAVLNTEEIEYNSIAAESCWCTNSSDDSSPNNKWKLINRGCIESRSGFTTPFLLSSNSASTNQSNPDRKAFVELSSGFFPAFTMFDSSQLIFKCLFRFCKHKHWCSLRKQCTDDHPQFFTTPPPKRFDDIRFLVKSFKVSVVSVPKVDSVSRGGVKSVCSFFWCLPGDKLLLVISLLTVILLLVTALAFVLFRRHNQLINYRSNVFKETNTNNSLLKPSNNHLIHGYCPIPDDIWKSQNYAMCSCIDDCPPVSSSLCKDHINTDLCLMLNSNTLISTKSSNKRSEYEVAHSRKLNHDLDNAENQTINQNVSHFHVNDDNASSVGKDVESTEL